MQYALALNDINSSLIAPHNPHAFKTLSVIHDEKGDTEKSTQVCGLFISKSSYICL